MLLFPAVPFRFSVSTHAIDLLGLCLVICSTFFAIRRAAFFDVVHADVHLLELLPSSSYVAGLFRLRALVFSLHLLVYSARYAVVASSSLSDNSTLIFSPRFRVTLLSCRIITLDSATIFCWRVSLLLVSTCVILLYCLINAEIRRHFDFSR